MAKKERSKSTRTGKYVFCPFSNLSHAPFAIEILQGKSLWGRCMAPGCSLRWYNDAHVTDQAEILRKCLTAKDLRDMNAPTLIAVPGPEKAAPLPHMGGPVGPPPTQPPQPPQRPPGPMPIRPVPGRHGFTGARRPASPQTPRS